MAPTPKPADKPHWATVIGVYGGRTNAITPPVGREPEGWTYLEKPPRNYSNFLWHYVGAWIDYLEACVDAGQKAATFVVAAEDASDAWKQMADYTVGAGADAAVTINAAMAALPAHGGRVLLSDGAFSLQTSIGVTANGCHLQGQGDGTRIYWANAGASGAMLTGNGVSGLTVSDMKFATLTSAPAYINGITLTACAARLHRLWFVGLYGDGTAVLPATPKGTCVYANSSTIQWSDIDVATDTTGPNVTDAAVAFVNGTAAQGENLRVVSLAFGGTRTTEAALYGNNSTLQARNVYATFTKHAVRAVGCTNSSITGVHGLQLGDDGVSLSNCYRVKVECAIATAVDGVSVANSSTCTVECRATACSNDGVSVNLSPYTQIVNADLDSIGRNGIYIYNTSDHSVVTGGTMNIVAGTGVAIESDHVAATGTVVMNANKGFRFSGCESSIATGCSSDDCTTYGVEFTPTATWCKFNDGSITAVADGVYDSGPGNTCSGNTFEDITNKAYWAVSTALGFRCSDNWFSGAGDAYIYINPGAVLNFPGVVQDNHGDDQSGAKPTAAIDIRANGGALITKVLVQNNWMHNAGAVADLRIEGAFTNAQSVPAADAGATVTFTPVQNNYVSAAVDNL